MRVLFINTVYGRGSTGRIVADLGKMLEEKGLIRDPKLFFVQKKCSVYDNDIQPGFYTLNTSMTADDMFAIIAGRKDGEGEGENEEDEEGLDIQIDTMSEGESALDKASGEWEGVESLEGEEEGEIHDPYEEGGGDEAESLARRDEMLQCAVDLAVIFDLRKFYAQRQIITEASEKKRHVIKPEIAAKAVHDRCETLFIGRVTVVVAIRFALMPQYARNGGGALGEPRAVDRVVVKKAARLPLVKVRPAVRARDQPDLNAVFIRVKLSETLREIHAGKRTVRIDRAEHLLPASVL